MLLELCSTAAFAPPPPIAFYEPLDRRPTGSAPNRTGVQPTTSASATALGGSVQDTRSTFASMVRDLAQRIQTLKVEAVLDQVPFSVASYSDFIAFMAEAQPKARPSLFLNDNGNLRAVWRNPSREQVGLQFLGSGNVQFVIFKQRRGTVARIAGVDAKANILDHIRASGALGLIAV